MLTGSKSIVLKIFPTTEVFLEAVNALARKEIISDFKLLAYKYSGRMWKGLQNFQDLCNNMKCSLINLCLKLDFYDKQLDELLGEKGNAFKGEGKHVHLRNYCYIFLTSIHQYLQTLPLGSLWTLLRTRMLILIMMQRHERKGNKLNLCFSINVKTQIERNCFLF